MVETPPFNILESAPADTAAASAFPADERRNRDIIESYLNTDHDFNTGLHRIVRMVQQTAAPTIPVGSTGGALYVKDVSGTPEAFYWDGTNEVQLTSGGSLNVSTAPDPFTALTYSAMLTWDVGSNPNATVTLTGNLDSLTVENAADGAVYILELTQDATGNRTWTPPASWYWSESGVAPALSTAAGATDSVTIMRRGNLIRALFARDWQT